jgi:predicted deacylase
MDASVAAPLPPIDVGFPDLTRWSPGNTGVPYVWTLAADHAGPHLLLQALTHGNEVCGAIALDWLLGARFRPVRGTVTVCFANVAAYRTFDPADPFASRCIDEDFNRLWTAEVLDGPRRTSELAKALGAPQHIVVDAGHAGGTRLRDYAPFDDPLDHRNALLVECGQHWEGGAPEIARDATLRFLRHFGMADPAFLDAHLELLPMPAQKVVEVTAAIAIATDDFAFAHPVDGLTVVPRAGTLLATDGSAEIRTPYDDCVLIMPTRRPKKGETAVRLGRFVE